jgi:hypothetical protein
MTMKKVAPYILWVGILAALAIPAFAETRTISWSPVTTYSDGTPIEAGKTVTYTACWTTDAGLSIGSLHTIGSPLSQTSTTFDPDLQGMTRGSTAYFTAKAVMNTGEESTLSPAYAWVVPLGTPSRNPAAPANIGIAGPVSSAAAEVWRLTWDSVTTYGDGASLEPGRTVRYTPYWTNDPALSSESLKPLASSISGTTLEFNPVVQLMLKNQVAYLTVVAILDTGDQSSLGAPQVWRVKNAGPVAPSKGQISKK